MAERVERKVRQTGKKRKLTGPASEQEASEATVTVTEINTTCKGKARSNSAKGKRLCKQPMTKGRDKNY